MAKTAKDTQPRALPTLSTISFLSSASRCHASTMTDHSREPSSSSPRTLPSTSAASEDVSSTGEVFDKLPKSLPEVNSIEPELQRPAVEPTKAPFFADDPYVDRLPQSIVEFYLEKNTISLDALVTVPLGTRHFKRYEDRIAACVHKRFDSDPRTQEITFRITTLMHCLFTQFVEYAIKKELRKLDKVHANFIAGIHTLRDARIKLPVNPKRRSQGESKGTPPYASCDFSHATSKSS
ncbi:hypothetical protein FCIRC_1220 [Fusarium circinatum]|uniref:Uncharacterized protein n=1 Tax=Fusarium circinatum TaxID=48490 RepID=A0A8H5UKU0_FUSCI|nr:hypothetical protein FCIRC_1220 [Fusarium circinatum]